MDNASRAALASLPKMDRVLEAGPLASLAVRRGIKRLAVDAVLGELRARLLAGESADVPDAEGMATQARARVDAWMTVRPRGVINATGVLLHTNLGRAPLGAQAVTAMIDAAGASELEIEMDSGARGSRLAWIRPLSRAVLGAQDVHVVNNNAAALLLACTVLGGQAGVALSRGQMVEIGDGFRVATMAGAGGCPVVAVGSTNRTHLRDYEAALEDGAAALLWVHLSNFRQQGYVAEVGLAELAALAKSRGVPLIADLGAGSLGEGLPPAEPTIQSYLDQGADLVLCSGDKLLGGPQAGLVAGRAELVERCRRHPMSRALRPDKVTLAALHATLVAHAADGVPDLPLHAMVAADPKDLAARAEALCKSLGWDPGCVRTAQATIGGGSLPGDTLPSVALAVPTGSVSRTARALRLGDPPVVGRIQDDTLLLDLRTVPPQSDAALLTALRAAQDPAKPA